MRTIDAAATGANIRRLIARKGITTFQLSQRLGLTTPNVCYRWYTGETMPRIDNLVLISSIVGCELGELIKVREVT